MQTVQSPEKARERKYARLFYAVYAIAWILAFYNAAAAAIAFIAAGYLLSQSITSGTATTSADRSTLWLMLAAVVRPGLGASWIRYENDAESRRFSSYLSQHECKFTGNVVVGMSKGGCDRFDNCEGPEEIEEFQYFCKTTGRSITSSQFRNGQYGN
jgi:hypothetical protein